jgi:Putative Flp pilus-assembly TadE/G-like
MKARLRRERGHAMVFTILFLTSLIAIAGLVIDVGSWYVQREKAQAAADMGALAAAAELPSDTGARSAGADYVKRNMADATAEVQPGYDNSPNKVEVRARTRGETFFLGVVGLDSVPISARAVAQKDALAVPLAIFVYDDQCDGFGFGGNGGDWTVTGGVHSNGRFKMNGNNITIGQARAGGPNDCDHEVNGANIKIGEGTEPARHDVREEWPLWFNESDFACTYTANKFEFAQNGQEIPPGVYCARESFKANANDQTGRITVLAPEIVINGNNQRFEPFAKDVLFFATSDKEMILDAHAFHWSGVIFHPRGRVKINGDHDSVLTGLIEGLHVEVNGNGFQMHGTGPESLDDISLIE